MSLKEYMELPYSMSIIPDAVHCHFSGAFRMYDMWGYNR